MWAGMGKSLLVEVGGYDFPGFLFSFLVMCMGEPITLPTVIIDPNQLYPELAKHIPSSNGEQTFIHREELCKMMNILELHLSSYFQMKISLTFLMSEMQILTT